MDSPNRTSKSCGSKNPQWARARYLLKSRLKRFPLTESPAIKIWRIGRYLFYRCKWKLAALIGTLRGTYAKGVDVDKVCWVSPKRIVYCSSRYFKTRDFKGHVIGGDWDRLENRFEDRHEYMFFKQVCLEGKDWSETIAYKRALNRLNRGEILWYAKDQSELDQRCKDRVSLFDSVRREGYRSQRELSMSGQINCPVEAEEEVTVSIGRHGDLLFCDGVHRLAIAKLLGIERIPVTIAVRHPEWMGLREDLLLYARKKSGTTHQPITHPDLDDIPARHECEEIFKMIKENMSTEQGRLLDIGAELGYYCHRFEDEGFDCYAVEDCQADLHFFRKLGRAENRQFKTIAASALDSREIRNTHFSVVLVLNIFRHFTKTKESYDKFVDLLKNLQTEELFFASQLPDVLKTQGAYKNYVPDESVEFMLRNSTLKKAECIGVAKDGRPLYRLC